MPTQIYNPEGKEHSRSRNLQGLLDNARRRGVRWVRIDKDDVYGADLVMQYEDDFYAHVHFASAILAEAFCKKRWQDKIL